MLNLTTSYDETIEALGQMEGPDWVQDDLCPHDLRYSTLGAIQWIEGFREDEDDLAYAVERGFTYCIYGPGGFHRYFVYADGTIKYSRMHGYMDAARAASLGFEIL